MGQFEIPPNPDEKGFYTRGVARGTLRNFTCTVTARPGRLLSLISAAPCNPMYPLNQEWCMRIRIITTHVLSAGQDGVTSSRKTGKNLLRQVLFFHNGGRMQSQSLPGSVHYPALVLVSVHP